MVTLIDAARALASVCDGAVTRDGQGFNGADSPFARSLIEQYDTQGGLSPKQYQALGKLLQKYRGQLSTQGIDVTALAAPPPQRAAQKAPQKAPAAAEAPKAVQTAPTPVAAPQTPPPWPYATGGDLLPFFAPGKTPRPQQVAALDQISRAFASGKRVAVLEMPTGGGKSFICQAVAQAVAAAGGKTHFLTVQKTLQDQYQRDFPAPEIEALKGRANYTCAFEATDAANAPCTRQGKGLLDKCVHGGEEADTRRRAVQLLLSPADHLCPYWKQLQKCNDNPITLYNFSSFLFQRRIGRFGKRELMIVDEAHNIESQLMSYVTMELTEWTLSIINLQIDREITSTRQLVDWLREQDVARIIAERLEDAKGDMASEDSGDMARAEVDALRELQGKIELFMSYIEKTEWSIDTVTYHDRRDRHGENRRKIVARPLYAKDFAQSLLFKNADRILVMSATILDIDMWAENLGLKREEIEHIQTPCDFPAENRPIHLDYAGNMGRKWFSPEANPKNPTKPLFINKVQQILQRHAGQRGMIHCHSFELSMVLRSDVASPRFMFQDDFKNDKKAMLEELNQRPDGVVVAPAMHEGFDLANDMARFQIIAKVPWPSLGDKVIKERCARDDRWYAWLAALKIVQSYGRIVRSKDDWGYTYIIDSGFDGFLARNGQMLPTFFREALRKYAPNEIRKA